MPSPHARWTAALGRVAAIGREPRQTLPRIINDLALQHAEAPALIGERATLSFAELARLTNRYARWTLDRVPPHGVVAILMENRPELMAAWLGVSQVGASAALLNPSLTGRSLAHGIDLVAPSHVIVTPRHADALAAVLPRLATRPSVWIAGGEAATGRPIENELARHESGRLSDRETGPVTLGDRALLIYTSGTTGLPKAAQLSHHRVASWCAWFAGLMDTRPTDRMYDCLPMHHSVGGVVAPGATLLAGGSVVIRERFSASRFWSDVVETRCTLFQYIGELCRYIVNTPDDPAEHRHRLRLCAGNGLRPDIWTRFQERFTIPEILEFYAATESTVSLYNVEGRVGSLGRVPAFLRHRSPAVLVRRDPDTGLALRGPDGICLQASPGETGELVGRIAADQGDLARRFDGYTDPRDTERKVLADVLAPGDRWFQSGDLMRQDEAGYFYFVDRVGETFRWRGENVSTTEVADAIRRVPGILDVAVYGVAVPGHEGRAGMAAIVSAPGAPIADGLWQALAADLPRYARPVFLRLVDSIDVTDTFKSRKQALMEAGYACSGIADPLFVYPGKGPGYIPLTADLHEAIVGGTLAL